MADDTKPIPPPWIWTEESISVVRSDDSTQIERYPVLVGNQLIREGQAKPAVVHFKYPPDLEAMLAQVEYGPGVVVVEKYWGPRKNLPVANPYVPGHLKTENRYYNPRG